MIYPEGFESKIGFDVIRRLVHEQCLSPLGQARCRSMSFVSDYNKVVSLLTQTHEMLMLMKAGLALPSEHLHDVTDKLKALRSEGSFMPPSDLYRLRMSLETLGRVHDFFVADKSAVGVQTPKLSALFASLEVFPEIIRDIDKTINKFGEVSDNASPELSDLRHRIMSASASLASIMQSVVSRGVSLGVLDKDTSPTVRDGRLVIPVNAANKRSIPGIVHDESATGKTSYIEPAEVVEGANRLKELHEAEKREVRRILLELADRIRPQVSNLLSGFNMLGIYDFIRAKAMLALEFDAQMPVMESEPEIDWYGAVHPALSLSLKAQGRAVVPLNLKLDSRQRILIISGPNAGGKSVCLKTAGVIQYMLQCGLLPTMHANSHASVFDNILIDIGDEQSLENDLSTYSSHLKNMKVFMQQASKRTFILVDEMGSGTEPQIGGALAQAILRQLNRSHVMGIITTHYQNLKTFADAEEGFVNGAMLYDRQQMQPLFKLSIGNPGSSFALEIANKIGLPRQALEDAREIVGSDYVNMDKYLLDLARDRRYWSNKRQSVKEKEARLDRLIEQIEEQSQSLKEKKRVILEEARTRAAELLSDSNSRIERAIMEIRNAQAEKERTRRVRRELDEYKKQLADATPQDTRIDLLPKLPVRKKKTLANTPSIPSEKAKPAISVDDYVRMSQGGVVGKVLSVNAGVAEVAFGAMRTRVPIDKLIKAVKPDTRAVTQTAAIARTTTDASRKRQLDFKQEIDLRGMRVDEALQAVAYFLDDAVQFEVPKVRILHGTGTGALRMAIRQYLQSNPDVVSFADEDVRFGGAGITVVNL